MDFSYVYRMTSRHLCIITIPLILYSCSLGKKNKNSLSINKQIASLQEKSRSQEDSTLLYLEKAEKIIKTYPTKVSDSLKMENNYLRGLYYFDAIK